MTSLGTKHLQERGPSGFLARCRSTVSAGGLHHSGLGTNLAKDPNNQCRITEAHLKKSYAAKAQVTHLANTASLFTAYLDGMLRSVAFPEPLASELHLVSGMLLQISGFQGQALGRSLANLVVAHRQLWMSQVRVSDADKSALLNVPISPGHTFRPAVEEILQRSHKEQEVSQQVPRHEGKRSAASGSYYGNLDSSNPHCAAW
ncbi:UNVERIFIED_CONTAM: hypothetical protein FKN15_034637 [Acipenser sinensis]